jgi:hypothetical protein
MGNVVSRLREYATIRKVSGSISDEVIDFFFNLSNLSSRILALGLAQQCSGNKYKEDSWGKALLDRNLDNLIAICWPIE